MKAKVIITYAFAEVVQSKYKIEPVDLIDGLRYLNRMMLKFNAQGIELGYTALANPEDVLTVPDTAGMCMIKNLALILWPQYNIGPVNPLIKFSAKRSLDSMRAQAINTTEPAQFPSTLPVGSGNYNGIYGDNFYTNDQSESVFFEVEK